MTNSNEGNQESALTTNQHFSPASDFFPVAVIVPPVVCHDLDPHTGIPFMPHIAGHAAGALREGGHNVQAIDCFGVDCHSRKVVGEFLLMGVDENWVATNLRPETHCVFIYARAITEFIAIELLIHKLNQTHPNTKIVLFENIQSVTSYALVHVADKFIECGADVVITGEPETRINDVLQSLFKSDALAKIPGLVYADGESEKVVNSGPAELVDDLDALPMPAWDLFPLDGYWSASFSHAPALKGTRFVPLLTSRGCPYRCTFCIAPSVNPKWRGRSAVNLVDEMEHMYRTLKITDFHISDLDPTVNDKRTRSICEELIRRNLPVTWKLAQGTKIETIKNEQTLELMAKAGCRFISFSPESGSKRMLEIMNKPFNHEHGLRMAKKMHALGIRIQAVFIAGVPGEKIEDQDASVAYAKKLIKAGVDEISLVIFTPLPGAKLADAISGFTHYSQCSPSPNWRDDYKMLTRYRRRMYLTLFSYKLIWHPVEFFTMVFRIFAKRFETKMEMSIYKQAKLYGLRYTSVLFRRI